MTLKQYAANIGKTPQAIYQRLQKEGVKLDSLREANDRHQLTPEGIATLDKLYDKQTTSVNQHFTLDTSSKELDEANRKIVELTIQLEAEQKARAAAESDRDAWRAQAAAAQQLADQAQRLHAQALEQTKAKQGLLERVKRFFIGDGQRQTTTEKVEADHNVQ